MHLADFDRAGLAAQAGFQLVAMRAVVRSLSVIENSNGK
jgi:hypothetical protein